MKGKNIDEIQMTGILFIIYEKRELLCWFVYCRFASISILSDFMFTVFLSWN